MSDAVHDDEFEDAPLEDGIVEDDADDADDADDDLDDAFEDRAEAESEAIAGADGGPTGARTESEANDDLRDLVLYLASNLIDTPDDVDVRVERRGTAVHLSLRVPEEELGKVIGRQGRIARAMRTAVMIAGSRHNVRASLDIEG